MRLKYLNILLISLIIISVSIIILFEFKNKSLENKIYEEKRLKVGDKAFIFNANDIDGKTIDIKGENVLLAFFNTECNSCSENLVYLEEFYRQIDSSEIKVIGITSANERRAKWYGLNNNLTFPIISDPQRDIFPQYFIQYTPFLLMVDKKSEIAYIQEYGQPMNQIFMNVINMKNR